MFRLRLVIVCLVLLLTNNLLFAQKFIGEAKKDKYIREALQKEIKYAKEGVPESQYLVGIHLLKGTLLEKDTSLGLRLLGEAKNNNYAAALEFFGDIEDNDSIAEQYYLEAIRHFNAEDRFSISVSDIQYKISHLFKNKRALYLDVASKFLMGEYNECSNIGDSIAKVEDIYDALILCYSSLANHKLAFEERKIDHSENILFPNIHRAKYKAQEALDFLSENFDDIFADTSINSTLISDILQSYVLAISCSRILQIPQYRIFINHVHSNIVNYKSRLSANMHFQLLELAFFDLVYNIEKNNLSLVLESLIPQFESKIKSLDYVDNATKSQIATLYNQLSEFLNYAAIEKEYMPTLKIAALNTMIHCRDYEFYSKKGKQDAPFKLIDWNEIKESMPKNSRAFLFFVYAKSTDTDSWNYVWSFGPDSSKPDLKYAGHSYWSETQFLWGIQDYKNVERMYIAGTNSMMLTGFSYGSSVVRLHSISDILVSKHHYENEEVYVIGKIKYSLDKTDEISETKGAVHSVGNFSTAEKEIQAINKAFGKKMTLYQGNEVTHQLFQDLSKKRGILHISTHGIFNKELLRTLNQSNPEAGLTGENILRSCGLMLSGYNNDKERNFISAYEIKDLQLDDMDLVFISACESGAGKVLATGDYSLAEAFHLSGVRNIIAIIDPINETVATRFAEHFYNQISNGTSYHDAFYKTKSEICPKDRIILFE